jgi:hypothetical protein
MTEHLQINAVAPTASYAADGIQCAFTFPFAIFKATDLEVWQDTSPQTSGFTVSGAGITTGGTVLFATPPPAGARVTLRRRIPILRTSDLQANGVILAKTLNDEFDFLTAAVQQVADDVTRAVARPVTSPSSASLALPEPAPGKALGWNADGTGLTNDPADFAATVAEVSAQAAIATAQAATATAQADLATTARAVAQSALTSAEAARTDAAASAAAAAASATAADVARIEWQGAWSDVTAYMVNDAVSYGGGSWICVAAHANQTPADNAFWDPLAIKGIDGTGAGDLVSANNLSDVADPATARTNLGAAAVSHSHTATDVGDFTQAAQDIVGTMIVAAGGSYDDGTGTITLPSATAQAVLDRLEFLELNLAVNTLRDQIDAGWSVLKMADGVADEFEDTAGIASSTGTYDATGDYIHNHGGYTVDLVPVMTSNSTPSGSVSTSSLQAGSGYECFDGNLDQANNYTYWAGFPAWVRYQFTSPKVINQYSILPQGGYRWPVSWLFQSSNDGSNWTTLHTVSSESTAGWAGRRYYQFSNSASYVYYRLHITAGSDATYTMITDLEMMEALAPTNITVTSVSSPAQAETTDNEARVILLHQPKDAVALNTDVTIEASRDGGTNWTAGTLVQEGAFDAATNILSAIIDLSGQPAGTAMTWRFKTFNAKEQRLHGVWMQWR